MAALDDYLTKQQAALTGQAGAASTSASPLFDPSKYVAGQQQPDPSKTYTDVGQTYIDRLTKTLAGDDPVVANARGAATAANAVGEYLAQRQGHQESINAGYTPGTLQTQRTVDRYQAGADQTALQRDNQVNQLQRDDSQAALQGAAGVEANAANRAAAMEQQTAAYTENLIKSVTDPVAQAYLRRVQAAGGDISAAYSQIYGGAPNTGTGSGGDGNSTAPGSSPPNPTGDQNKLADGFRSQSPQELALANAGATLAATHPELVEGTPEYAQALQALAGGQDIQPILDAQKKHVADDALQTAKISGLQGLSEAQKTALAGTLDASSFTNLPQGKPNIDAALGPGGTQFFKVDGQLYKLDSYLQQTTHNGGRFTSDRHRDWTVVTDGNGQKLWISQQSGEAKPIILTSAPANYVDYTGDYRLPAVPKNNTGTIAVNSEADAKSGNFAR